MRHDTEAAEIRALKGVVERGYVYRGLKPVNWCFDCQSALAEAEVEYKDVESYTIDVAFRLCEEDEARTAEAFSVKLEKPCFIVIWTTTPWTLPSSSAALKPAAARRSSGCSGIAGSRWRSPISPPLTCPHAAIWR